MNPSCNFFLSEKIALAACKAISKNPEVPLEKENLVKLQHGNISKENAQKNINTLKKLGILDETGLPTDLGRNWANEITRKDATIIIVQTSFPDGTIQASSLPSNDFVAWIAKNANTTKSVAEKSVTTFRILMRLCEPETPKKRELSTPFATKEKHLFRNERPMRHARSNHGKRRTNSNDCENGARTQHSCRVFLVNLTTDHC